MVVVKWSLFIVRVMVPVAFVQPLPGRQVSHVHATDIVFTIQRNPIRHETQQWGVLVNISGVGEPLCSHTRYAELARQFTHVAEVFSGRPGVAAVGFPLIAEAFAELCIEFVGTVIILKITHYVLEVGKTELAVPIFAPGHRRVAVDPQVIRPGHPPQESNSFDSFAHVS